MEQNKFSTSYTITGPNPYPWIRWWYFLVAPPAPMAGLEVPLAEREFLRRGKLISIALLIEFAEFIVALVPIIHSAGIRAGISLGAGIVILAIASVLNRMRQQLFASILIMLTLEAVRIVAIVPPGSGGLDMLQLPALALLVQPLVISALLFPAWGILVVGAINMLLTTGVLLLAPRAATLQAYMQTSQASAIISIPLTVLFTCALVTFIMITSLQESMSRADEAEEVTKLQEAMALHVQQELQTKHQLEEGIQEITTQLTRFSNGDPQARIRLEQGHVLWSIASTINSMVGRFARLREQEQPMEQTQAALQTYLAAIRTARVRGTQLTLPRTMTDVDTLADELLAYSSSTLPRQPRSDNRSVH